MSDQKLRELERRWKETGSPEDEAAYLLERVRVGDLTQERLELAAYCGHEGARRAAIFLTAGRWACRDDANSPAELLDGLANVGGRIPAFVGALAAARLVLPLWESATHNPIPRGVLTLAEQLAVVSAGASTNTELEARLGQAVVEANTVAKDQATSERAPSPVEIAAFAVIDAACSWKKPGFAAKAVVRALSALDAAGEDPRAAGSRMSATMRQAVAWWALARHQPTGPKSLT